MVASLKVNGVDISHHQGGKLDFGLAKRNGVQFVIHKATEGSTYIDPLLERRRAEVEKSGLAWGVYHFARPSQGDAAAEAQHFIKVGKPKAGDIMPVLDLEDNGGLNPKDLDNWARSFVETVKKLTGFDCMIYTPFALPSVGHLPLWVARYSNVNADPIIPKPWKTPTLRQFSNGIYGVPKSVAGIGNVDLNTFGPGADLSSILTKKTPPLPGPTTTQPREIDLFFQLSSLQYSDGPKQQASDVEAIFKVGADIMGGTEAGPETAYYNLLKEAAGDYGYRLANYKSNWVAVLRDNIVKNSWEAGQVDVMKNELVFGPGHDTAFVWCRYEDKRSRGHRIATAVAHNPTKGRTPADPNWKVNLAVAEAAKKWFLEFGQGKDVAFWMADTNQSDRDVDTFHGAPATTLQDELRKWEPTHGYITAMDVIASYDRDGRVRGKSVRVLDDKEFPLFTDHYVVRGHYGLRLLQQGA